MKTVVNKLIPISLLGTLVVCWQAHAQSSCSKKMLNHPTSASDQCLSDQVEALKSRIEKRYAQIGRELPEVAAPPKAGESEELSKARLNEVYTLWTNYQEKACAMDAARYDLQKRYENRMYSICWIAGAKQHLALLR
jgi:hypothetical protein